MPDRIPYDQKVAAMVRRLVRDSLEVEAAIDDEQYPAGVARPAVRAAWALRSEAWQRWHAASYSILRSVCGSDSHPIVREWYRFCSDSVVDCCRRGRGLLNGFLDAWRAGALWAASEASPDEEGVVK